MHITVVGSGYVGLVSGAGFADFGLTVTCVDCDEQKIRMLNEGRIPIYEIGLEEIIRKNSKNGRLSFSTDLRAAVQQSLVVFIAVGTPEKLDGEPDMSQVEAVACSLAEYIDDYKVIVTKSTVPVGTSKRIRELIEERQPRKVRFDVVSNPEFLREGSAIEDFMRPNRIVIGADSEHAAAIVKDIYRPLYLIETPFVVTTPETAELAKYASNAFLATKISFVNEMANLCEKVGADIHDVARSMGLDRRIGPKFLHPGPGFGGSCFPKDLSALVKLGQKHGLPMRIASAASEVNQVQKKLLVQKTKALLNGAEGKVVGVLGLSFKPNTDDVRESPAIFVCRELAQTGTHVQAYDPVATQNAKDALGQTNVSFCETAYEAASAADVLVIATEWNEFRNIDLSKIKSVMKNPVILDSRNIFEPERVRDLGFIYSSTGRLK
jgi:UDPglucose 6-dehydrogenase